MLNCCIEHKKARDAARKDAAGENGLPVPQVSPGKSWDSWSDSEDEFFECLSDTEDMKEIPGEGTKGAGAKIKPEGRLQPHGKLTLLNSPEPLYIPVTQVGQEDDRSTFTASFTSGGEKKHFGGKQVTYCAKRPRGRVDEKTKHFNFLFFIFFRC